MNVKGDAEVLIMQLEDEAHLRGAVIRALAAEHSLAEAEARLQARLRDAERRVADLEAALQGSNGNEVLVTQIEGVSMLTAGADSMAGTKTALARAKEDQDYLDCTGVLKFMQSLLQTIMKERPKDPYKFMSKHLKAGVHNAFSPATAVTTETPHEPEQIQDTKDELGLEVASAKGNIVKAHVAESPVEGKSAEEVPLTEPKDAERKAPAEGQLVEEQAVEETARVEEEQLAEEPMPAEAAPPKEKPVEGSAPVKGKAIEAAVQAEKKLSKGATLAEEKSDEGKIVEDASAAKGPSAEDMPAKGAAPVEEAASPGLTAYEATATDEALLSANLSCLADAEGFATVRDVIKVLNSLQLSDVDNKVLVNAFCQTTRVKLTDFVTWMSGGQGSKIGVELKETVGALPRPRGMTR